MRRLVLVSLLALWPAASGLAAAFSDSSRPSDRTALRQAGAFDLAQDIRAYSGSKRPPRVRPAPGVRPDGVARPGSRPGYQPASPGYRPAYRPASPGYRPAYRPGYRPGYRPPPAAWRPVYPGWRPGWAPAPWYGSYWRPGYGWAAAAGLIAVGVLAATAATAYSVPPPPDPNLCWFYTDQTYQTGYWASCPPPP
jgi:hypothetical protein